jgi:hypothetical protein
MPQFRFRGSIGAAERLLSVFASGPNLRYAAFGVAEVIEIDGVSALYATGEDEAVLAKLAEGDAGESDDAVLPRRCWTFSESGPGAGSRTKFTTVT